MGRATGATTRGALHNEMKFPCAPVWTCKRGHNSTYSAAGRNSQAAKIGTTPVATVLPRAMSENPHGCGHLWTRNAGPDLDEVAVPGPWRIFPQMSNGWGDDGNAKHRGARYCVSPCHPRLSFWRGGSKSLLSRSGATVRRQCTNWQQCRSQAPGNSAGCAGWASLR